MRRPWFCAAVGLLLFAACGPTGHGRPGRPPAALVAYAVGDLCAAGEKLPGCALVGDLIAGDPASRAVFILGDGQYGTASLSEFDTYYDAYLGSGKGLKDKSYPVPGNHEYRDPAGPAKGYFDYWGVRAGDPSKGYYAATVGAWRLIATNSNCAKVGGCGPESLQGRFVRSELASAPRCAVVIDHDPAITEGKYAPGTTAGRQLFRLAYDGGADLFLSGHDHLYERFAPLNAALEPDPRRGVRQFVVGTGGKSHHALSTASRQAESSQDTAFGALRLLLSRTGYTFQFLDTGGRVLDSGGGSCH